MPLNYGLIILAFFDILNPDIFGWEFCKILNKWNNNNDLPYFNEKLIQFKALLHRIVFLLLPGQKPPLCYQLSKIDLCSAWTLLDHRREPFIHLNSIRQLFLREIEAILCLYLLLLHYSYFSKFFEIFFFSQFNISSKFIYWV